MFSTVRPPWQRQYVTPKSTISPPPLHNARYEGWVRPPIQLPHVAFAIDTPSRHSYEVTATNSQPHSYASNRAHTISGVQGHVNSQRRNINIPHSWAWNGGAYAYAPTLQGNSGIDTRAQHDTDDARFIYDQSIQRTMPSSINITQKVLPHPFLAPPSMPLIYDLRYPPTSLRFPSSSPFAGCGCEVLRLPLTSERPRKIRLISPDFPWAFDVSPSAGEENVTCLDVLGALYASLQRPLTDTEWCTVGDVKHASLIRARDRRLHALQEGSNSATRARHTVDFAPSADAPHHMPMQREPLLLRVDWLGSRIAFLGLVKDDVFARSRLIPGGGQPPETWVVKFERL